MAELALESTRTHCLIRAAVQPISSLWHDDASILLSRSATSMINMTEKRLVYDLNTSIKIFLL